MRGENDDSGNDSYGPEDFQDNHNDSDNYGDYDDLSQEQPSPEMFKPVRQLGADLTNMKIGSTDLLNMGPAGKSSALKAAQ